MTERATESLLASGTSMQKGDQEPSQFMSDEDIDSLESQAGSLWNDYNGTGDVQLLVESIGLFRLVLDLRVEGHPARDHSYNNLATALLSYQRRTGDSSVMAEAVGMLRSVLKTRSEQHPYYVSSCSNLGSALSDWYGTTGDESVLDEATLLLRKALAAADQGHPDPADAYNNLAATLSLHYNRDHDLAVLEEVMQLHRKALSLRPGKHPMRPKSCDGLSTSLLRYYEHTGDVSHLDEATGLQRESLDLYPEGHPGRTSASIHLSELLQRRFEHSGDFATLDEATALDMAALNMLPKNHPDRALACMNIAFALTRRKHYSANPDSLNTVDNLLQTALALRPEGHPDRTHIYLNLTTVRMHQFKLTKDISQLDAAIQLARVSIDLGIEARLSKAGANINLARMLMQRCVITAREDDAQEVVELCGKAMELSASQNRWRPLLTLAALYATSDMQIHDMSKSIDKLLEAVSLPCYDPLRMALQAQETLRKLQSDPRLSHDDHLRLLPAFEAIINTLPVLAGFALSKKYRLTSQGSFGDIGSCGFASALVADKIEFGIELLEHARATMWSQELHIIDPQTKDLPQEIGSKLEGLLRSMASTDSGDLETPRNRTLTASDVRHRHNNQIQSVLKEIRATPGLERFMLGHSSSKLMQASRDHPVVLLVTAAEISYAIIMKSPSEPPGVLRLSIKITELARLRLSMSRYRSRGGPVIVDEDFLDNRGMVTSSSNSDTATSLRRIWTQIVQPIIHCLGLKRAEGRSRPRLHWCPTGPFTFIPLHAAGTYTGSQAEWCANYVVSSYTPTVSALLRAQDHSMSSSSVAYKLLMVAEAKPANSMLHALTSVQEELAEIRSAVAASPQVVQHIISLEKSTTVDQMAKEMRDSSMVHLACHGIQNSQDALESGFLLGDGQLTVARLMELKLDRAFFAFLSACETAKGDEGQPDQTVHLAAAMLFAGFKSLVATMWAIADADGPKVARFFYRTLLSGGHIDADSIAFALDEAVTNLRESDVSPDRWVPFIHVGA